MKSLLFIFLSISFFEFSPIARISAGGHKLTLQEAQQVLGESCLLKEEASSVTDGGHKYTSTYLSNSSDEKSGNVIALYYSFESYKDEAAASALFKTFKDSNRYADGFELMDNLGDECFFHSDNQNFYLIVARKGNELVRLKVNKITSRTSSTEMKKIASALIQRV